MARRKAAGPSLFPQAEPKPPTPTALSADGPPWIYYVQGRTRHCPALEAGIYLSAFTVLSGPNWSGKTAVENAMTLACMGFAGDLDSRDVVRAPAALAAIAQAQEDGTLRLDAHVSLGRGAGAEASGDFVLRTRRVARGAKAGEVRVEVTGTVLSERYPVRFPLVDFLTANRAGAQRAKEFYLQVLGEGQLDLSTLDPAVRPSVEAQLRVAEGDPRLALEQARARVLTVAGQVAEAAEQLARLPRAPHWAEDEVAAEAEVAALMAAQEEAETAYRQAQAARAVIYQDLVRAADLQFRERTAAFWAAQASLREDAHAAEMLVRDLENTYQQAATPPAPKADPMVEPLWALCFLLTAHSPEQPCPVCGGDLPTSMSAPLLTAAREELEHVLSAQSPGPDPEVLGHVRQDLEDAKQLAGELRAALRAAEQGAPQQTPVGALARTPELIAADVEITRAETAWTTAKARANERMAEVAAAQAALRQANIARDAQEARVEELKAAHQTWQGIVVALEGIVQRALKSRVPGFVRAVQEMLPRAYNYALALESATEREGFRRGARWNGRTAALSESQRVAVTLAEILASAPAEGLTVAIPEDRAWDQEHLREVITRLSQAVAALRAAGRGVQVLFPTVYPPEVFADLDVPVVVLARTAV